MKQEFPEIKIGSVAKKVYSIDLSGGGSDPATLRVSFLADNTNYIPNSNKEFTVQIGSYYTFKGYIVSSSVRNSVSSGTTKELTLVDTSIILDKLWVGLRGKDGPPQASLSTSNAGLIGRSQNASTNFGVLNPINSLSSANSLKSSTQPITIFEAQPDKFPSNLILLGEAIDPCKDFDSDNPIDKCDPCVQEPISKVDCLNSRSINILDVDYTFNDLIKAARSKNIFFDSEFSSSTNYRAQYRGTLREVLNNWCQDYGYSFYWEDGKVKFINLSNGIAIRDDALKSENCKIEDFSETKSIEGNAKNINIAYFGKAGEIKSYDCSKSSSGSKDQGGEKEVLLECMSLDALADGNTALLARYKSRDILKIMVTAAYYNKDLRDLICYSKLLGFTNPSSVKLGPQYLMGWDIKAICYEDSSDDDVSSDYTSGGAKRLYNSLLGSKNGKSAIFSAEKIEQIKKNKGYFVIVNPIGSKAYEFERNLAENFCGRYWTKSTNRTESVNFESPEGSAKAYPNLLDTKQSFILPGIDITHPYIRNADISILNQANFRSRTDFIVLDRPQIWTPSPDSDSMENFLNEVLKIKFEDITSSVGVFKLKKDHKVYLVYEIGSGSGIANITADVNSDSHPSDKVPRGSSFDGQPVLGIRKSTCSKIKFSIDVPPVKGRSSKKEINIFMPVMSGGYLVRRNYQGTSFKPNSEFKTIIPKLEIIVTDAGNNLNDDDCVSYNVNSQNITDNNLSRLERIGFNCYIDKSTIYTYARSILADINQNTPKMKITRNYTILGLPKTKFTPEDGLTSFSIRLDQGGTRTSLTFSNMFPIGESPTFKEKKLRNLLKEQSNKSFATNIF
jgi:hypothetical protein